MNTSIPIQNSVEFIDVVPMSPLIYKCKIKVCYVGDEPNRNGSIITKEAAIEIANTLPGCPIVGFYNELKEDFEGHNQIIKIGDGNMEVKDTTIPYGFVDMNPKVWFQKFEDGPNKEVHEYLVTEGYIWAGVYPESKRILTDGNNQSMELDDRFVDGNWSENEDWPYSFFIINDAVISKLCILGEDVEPCFEGAQIKVDFSLETNKLKNKFEIMAEQLKDFFNEGGENNMENFEKKKEDENKEKSGQKEEEEKKEKTKENEEDVEKNAKKKNKCSLENDENGIDYAEEYVKLYKEYDSIKEELETIKNDYSILQNELEQLRTFKLESEREEKQAMVDSFSTVSDEDKKNIVENIDSYSLDDIEAKLSVICVRNQRAQKESAEQEEKEFSNKFSYSGVNSNESKSLPEWLKPVENIEKNRN